MVIQKKICHLLVLTFAALVLSVLFGQQNGGTAMAQTESRIRLRLENLQYQGAFRLKASDFGESSINYAQGPLAYNPANASLFIVGHSHHQAVAEFKIPQIRQTDEMANLSIVEKPLQPFSRILNRATGGNLQKLDRIGGMAIIPAPSGPKLIVNAYRYYDAPGKVSMTTCVISNLSKLINTEVEGFYSFMGGAGHTSGWLSPIPASSQQTLAGNYLTGQSSGQPIISRFSVGPSLFTFKSSPDDWKSYNVHQKIPTVKCLDFSLKHPLAHDLSNDTGSNTLWTHLSRVTFGFIPDRFNTYVTIGYSGGHKSGVCYKCAREGAPKKCGGYCPKDINDNQAFYWLWDLADLYAVRQGKKPAHMVRPYEYGIFPVPFPCDRIGGGSFDPDSGRLFLTLLEADKTQGRYARPPLIAVFKVKQTGGPDGVSLKTAPRKEPILHPVIDSGSKDRQ